MRASRLLLTALCAFALPLQMEPTAWAATWSRVHPPETRFSISMPAPAQVKHETKDTVVGDVKVTNLVAKDGNSVYSVTVSFLPDFVTRFVGEEKIFKNTQGEILKNFYAKRTGSSRKRRAGYTGRELSFQVPNENGQVALEGTSEMYYHEGKLVVLTAVTPAGTAGEDDRRKFLDSVILDPDAQPPPAQD